MRRCTHVADAKRQVHLERLVIDLVLDGLLALVERGADLARLRLVGGTGHLGLELGLEWPLGLGEELGAGVGPRRELGGGDGDGRAREVADLDLRAAPRDV